MLNLKKHILRNNGQKLQPRNPQEGIPKGNCRYTCPMDGKGQSCKSVVYKATVVDENDNTEIYTGQTENTFKVRQL